MGRKKAIRTSYAVDQAIIKRKDASPEAIDDLRKYETYIKSLEATASRQTHYGGLSDWSHQAYDYVHVTLKKYGFINGNREANEKNADASFWWAIYGVVSNVVYSPHLNTMVALHHSSAYERNTALIQEIKDILR